MNILLPASVRLPTHPAPQLLTLHRDCPNIYNARFCSCFFRVIDSSVLDLLLDIFHSHHALRPVAADRTPPLLQSMKVTDHKPHWIQYHSLTPQAGLHRLGLSIADHVKMQAGFELQLLESS